MQQIKIIPRENLDAILPLVYFLNENEDQNKIKNRIEKLKEFDNYFCIGVYENEELIGCCGVWKLFKIYAGPHLEVDNVAVLPDHRSKNLGEKMMDWVTGYAKENGFNSIELNAYIINKRGVAFWEKVGCEKKGYHMVKFCQGDGWVL